MKPPFLTEDVIQPHLRTVNLLMRLTGAWSRRFCTALFSLLAGCCRCTGAGNPLLRVLPSNQEAHSVPRQEQIAAKRRNSIPTPTTTAEPAPA